MVSLYRVMLLVTSIVCTAKSNDLSVAETLTVQGIVLLGLILCEIADKVKESRK